MHYELLGSLRDAVLVGIATRQASLQQTAVVEQGNLRDRSYARLVLIENPTHASERSQVWFPDSCGPNHRIPSPLRRRTIVAMQVVFRRSGSDRLEQ